jgi:two-component system catabolic regulation response regulator CreB
MVMKQMILIVEDEPAIADNIRFALETEGFETISQAIGSDVLRLLKEQHVNLVILDIGLPDVNGLELCKAIREHHDIPIIFVTARSDEVDRVVGLEIGADDYVVKPFSPRELSARVKAVLRRSGALPDQPAGHMAVSLFRLEEEKRRIFYCAERVDLSRYEYEILKLFISRPGRIFSRENLMTLVWDEPAMSTDRTVDAHIKNIRKKLKTIRSDLDPIITHRSVGYSLREDL